MQLVKYTLAQGPLRPNDFWSRDRAARGRLMYRPANAAGEDDGYVLLYVYDAARNASDLVILDAGRFARHPLATIHLPQRVPSLPRQLDRFDAE